MSTSFIKWNLEKEHGLGDDKMPGINTSMMYMGSKNSAFPMHQEDGDLLVVNNLHLGGYVGGGGWVLYMKIFMV